MADRQDSHYPGGATGGKSGASAEKRVPGPVPMHHRLKLGEGDGSSNPFGDGEPSKVSTVQNGKKGW